MAAVDFSYNGRGLRAEEGVTVAEALRSNGIRLGGRSMRLRVWRDEYHPLKEVPSAWVSIDGIANINAYRVRLKGGMKIASQTRRSLLALIGRYSGTGFYYRNFTRSEFARNFFFERVKKVNDYGGPNDPWKSSPGAVSELVFEPSQEMAPDVLIVGAGRSGLAALAALNLPEGRTVILVDALPRDIIEGNLRQLVLDMKGDAFPPELCPAAADTLDGLLKKKNATLLDGTTIFGAFEGGEYTAARGYSKILLLKPSAAILCTGSEEVKPVFQKNDIPGVITSRTLLSMPPDLFQDRKLPVLCLEAPLSVNYLSRISAVVKPTHIFLSFNADEEYAAQLSSVFGIAGQDIVSGRPSAAYGTYKVETLTVSLAGGGTKQFPTDLLVLAGRRQPRSELALLLSLNSMIDAETGMPVPAVNGGMLCGGDVYACGSLVYQDRTRSIASALVAAESVSIKLGMKGRSELMPSLNDVMTKRTEIKELAHGQPGGKAVVCPCLDVTIDDMRRLYSEGYETINRMRRFSGLFMGPCQGARCYRNVFEEYHSISGKQIDLPTVRPPLVPVYLGALALTDIPIEEEKK